jgi:hypothetical protein
MRPRRPNTRFSTFVLAIYATAFICGVATLCGTLPVARAAVVNATNLFGQIDGSNNPIWSQNAADNNASSTNNEGFNHISSLALDTVNHRLFVADSGHNRVLVFPLDSDNKIASHTAVHVLGACDFTSDGATSPVSASNFGGFFNLAFDNVNDRLFVSDAHRDRVMAFDVNPSTLTDCESATFEVGQPNFTTASAATDQSTLNHPDDIEYDSTYQRLFVSDEFNNRVMAFSVPAGSTSSINGEQALFELGQPDFVTATATTTQNGLNDIFGEAYDPVNHHLFVSDGGNKRVMAFRVAGDATSSINGEQALFELGEPDFTTATGGTTQTSLVSPDDINYDTFGNRLFVGDLTSSRIMIWQIPADATSSFNGAAAQNTLSQDTWTSSTYAIGQNTFENPEAPHAFDAAHNRLFIYDGPYLDVRAIEIDLIHITTASLASSTIGTPYSQAINVSQTQGTSQSYSLYSGSLPSGLTLSTSTGTISGTPTQATTTTFTIEADDNFPTGPFFDRATYSLSSLSTDATMSSFSFPTASSIIDATAHTVSITVPFGTNVASLTPTIGLAAGASVSPASGTAHDFTNPATYTVTAEDGSTTQAYIVTVTVGPNPNPTNAGGGNGPIVGSGPFAPGTSTNSTLPAIAATLAASSLMIQTMSSSTTSATTLPPLTAQTLTLARDLTLGARGDDVAALQWMLDTTGFSVATSGPGAFGELTTFFGPATQAALAQYQETNGISPSQGFFGPITRATLATTTFSLSTGSLLSATGQGTYTRDLELGDQGPDVLELQQFLNSNGYVLANYGPGAPGHETNLFGFATRYQLKQFQLVHNILPANGDFGASTRLYIAALSQ